MISMNQFIFALSDVLSAAISIVLYAIIIRAILSWIRPYNNGKLEIILEKVTEPLLGPLRTVLPPLGGMDLSPMVAIIALGVIKQIIQAFLYNLAYGGSQVFG